MTDSKIKASTLDRAENGGDGAVAIDATARSAATSADASHSWLWWPSFVFRGLNTSAATSTECSPTETQRTTPKNGQAATKPPPQPTRQLWAWQHVRLTSSWPFISTRHKYAGSDAASVKQRPSSMEGLFRVSNYRLFHVNAEAGLFEKKLMSIDIFLSRSFKAASSFTKRIIGVPATLSMPKASWGHARRQSFGSLVCFPCGVPGRA